VNPNFIIRDKLFC